MLHSAQAQVARPFNDIIGGPHPLQDHAGGSEMFPAFHFVPLVLLGSPFARGFAAFRAIVEVPLTLVLVMMSEQKKAVLLRDADPTWRQLYENTLPDLRQVDGQGTTWLRKTNHHAVNLDSGPLIRWWTTQLNALFTEVTDLGRYRRADGLLDAGNAYRELRSLDRIISNCVRVQVRPDEHAIRVGLAFEFFDLLPNILDRHVGPAHIWQTLANPSTAKKILRAAFSQAPTDDGNGETPGLATATVKTPVASVQIGIVDYDEPTTYLLVPGSGRERLSRTLAVLETLETAGALHIQTDLFDLAGVAPGATPLEDRVAELERRLAETQSELTARRRRPTKRSGKRPIRKAAETSRASMQGT